MPRLAEPDGIQKTELARRRSRFRFAVERAARMADDTPQFTAEELEELAAIFLSRVPGRSRTAA